MTELYAYAGCDGCRKAVRWLKERGIRFEERPIRDQPPGEDQLRAALATADGRLKKLFNVSGRDYRELGLKDRLGQLSESEAFALLRGNGNLVKRPFLAVGSKACAGFDEAVWTRLLG